MKAYNKKRKPKHHAKCKWGKRKFGEMLEFEYDRLLVVNMLDKNKTKNLIIVSNWKNYWKNI